MTVAVASWRPSAIPTWVVLFIALAACGDDGGATDTGAPDTGALPDSAPSDSGSMDTSMTTRPPDAEVDSARPDLAGWQVVLRDGDCAFERAQYVESLGDPLWEPCDAPSGCETIVDEPAYVRRYTYAAASEVLDELRVAYHQSIAPRTDFTTVLVAERGGRIVEAFRGCEDMRPHFGPDGGFAIAIGDWLVYRPSVDDALPWRSLGRVGSIIDVAVGPDRVAWATPEIGFALTGEDPVVTSRTGNSVVWAGNSLLFLDADALGVIASDGGVEWLTDRTNYRGGLVSDGDLFYWWEQAGGGEPQWHRGTYVGGFTSSVLVASPSLEDTHVTGNQIAGTDFMGAYLLDLATGLRVSLGSGFMPRSLTPTRVTTTSGPNLRILALPRP